jgi:cytochrome c553
VTGRNNVFDAAASMLPAAHMVLASPFSVMLAAAAIAQLAPIDRPSPPGIQCEQPCPDLALGRHLAAECTTCHRPARGGGQAIPDLHGMPEGRIVQALGAYRDRQLPNPVMQTVAGRLTDEDIAALAAYFAAAAAPR